MQYEPYQNEEREDDMSDVEHAAYLTRDLVENRRPKVGGSVEVALEQLASQYALGFSKLRSFYHPSRRPKTVAGDWLRRLRAAYLNECRRTISNFKHKLEIEQRMGDADDLTESLLDEAKALLAKIDEKEKA